MLLVWLHQTAELSPSDCLCDSFSTFSHLLLKRVNVATSDVLSFSLVAVARIDVCVLR